MCKLNKDVELALYSFVLTWKMRHDFELIKACNQELKTNRKLKSKKKESNLSVTCSWSNLVD